MQFSSFRLATLLSLLLLAACQPAIPGPAAPSPPETAIGAVVGGDIEVTSLDALPVPQGVTPAVSQPVGDKAEGATTGPVQSLPPTSQEDPVTPAEALPAAPVAPKFDVQIACERKGGIWRSVGTTKLNACVKTTKDFNKACTKQSQCESQCLARSGTCAPLKPMLGCNEVLQENGARVTLCIE